MAKTVKFNKYNNEENFNNAIIEEKIDDGTFSVVEDTKSTNSLCKNLYIGDVRLTDNYNTHINDTSITMPNSVGGIQAGTSVETLSKMSLGEVLDTLLFPTLLPKLTEPYIKFDKYGDNNFLVGSVIRKVSNDMVSVNYGSWNKTWGNNGKICNASNGVDSMEFSINENIIYPETETIIDTDSITINVKVVMSEGDYPTTSNGTQHNERYEGGIYNSSITIYPYYEWWATTSSEIVEGKTELILEKQPVKQHLGIRNATGIITTLSGGENQQLIIPGIMNNIYCEVNGTWSLYSGFNDEWEISTKIENNRTYNVYTRNGIYGSIKIKFDLNPEI